MLQRSIDRMKRQVGLFRKYRVGELPDIQISYRDLLLPLMAIIKNDVTIATEIFVEIFSKHYNTILDKTIRNKLTDRIKSLLENSLQYDYGCINCMHRIAMELLKIDGFSISADLI